MANNASNKLYYKSVQDLHFLLIIILGVSLIISILILVYTIMHNSNYSEQNMKKLAFNSWQFPMLLALFIESIVFYYY